MSIIVDGPHPAREGGGVLEQGDMVNRSKCGSSRMNAVVRTLIGSHNYILEVSSYLSDKSFPMIICLTYS